MLNNPLNMMQTNMMQMLSQLRQNPVQFLRQRGVNIPQNMNDPNAIIQHLMNSGQVSQQLIEYVCDELKELEKKTDKGEMSMSDIEKIEKLSSIKKNLLKGEMLYDEVMGDEQSGRYPYMGGFYARDSRGGSYRGGSYEGSYTDDMDGMSMRGSYARGRRNARRDSMGRYSGERGYSRAGEFADKIEELMDSAPNEQIKRDMERLVSKIEQM